MGCLEKGLGLILGLFLVVVGIISWIQGAYDYAVGPGLIFCGLSFAILNWLFDSDSFSSFSDSFSGGGEFIGFLKKFLVTALISCVVGIIAMCLFN